MLNDRILIPVVAGVLAIASWVLLRASTPDIKSQVVFANHSADYYSTGYRKREMDAFGLPSSEIIASKMVHYSDDGTVHLEAPKLSFFHGQLPPWVITAERGVLSNDGKDLWLQGSVLATRAAVNGGRAIKIETTEVHVRPETSDAETAQWAALSSPPDVTTGIGMQLHFVDPIHIKLLSKVRGTYGKH